MKRRLSCIIMAIALVLCVMPVLTYAATEPGTSPEVSKAFIEDINLVFSGNGSVYDSQHIDITENFIHTYRTAYGDIIHNGHIRTVYTHLELYNSLLK